ncbi:hypothetical protein RUND412_008039 [Rhizina undulata]
MTDKLPANLLALFAPRPPLRYLPHCDQAPEKRRTAPIAGVAAFLEELRKPDPDYVPTESWLQKRDRLREEKKAAQDLRVKAGLDNYDPAKDPQIRGDPYKTLFVSRLNYDVKEVDLEREFGRFGPIERIRITDECSSMSNVVALSKAGNPVVSVEVSAAAATLKSPWHAPRVPLHPVLPAVTECQPSGPVGAAVDSEADFPAEASGEAEEDFQAETGLRWGRDGDLEAELDIRAAAASIVDMLALSKMDSTAVQAKHLRMRRLGQVAEGVEAVEVGLADMAVTPMGIKVALQVLVEVPVGLSVATAVRMIGKEEGVIGKAVEEIGKEVEGTGKEVEGIGLEMEVETGIETAETAEDMVIGTMAGEEATRVEEAMTTVTAPGNERMIPTAAMPAVVTGTGEGIRFSQHFFLSLVLIRIIPPTPPSRIGVSR